MNTATFEYNGATFTVRRPVVRDRLHIDIVQARLNEGSMDALDAWANLEYARFLVLTTVEGEPGFVVPVPAADAETLMTGRDAWLEQDAEFLTALRDAAERASDSPNQPELQPGVSDEKKDKLES